MSDLAKHERAESALAVALDFDAIRASKVRHESASIIGNVLRAKEGRPEIDVLLVLGTACPLGYTKWDKAIWLEECHRLFPAMRPVGEA